MNALNYKLYIISPDESMEIVDLKTSNQYEFGAETKGIYKTYASVTSPVSYSIGSETDRCIKIAVGYDYETSKNLSTVYHGHLYQLVKKRQASWGQAKKYCEEHHSCLAAVTDADENRQIAKLIQQNGEDVYFFETSYFFDSRNHSLLFPPKKYKRAGQFFVLFDLLHF